MERTGVELARLARRLWSESAQTRKETIVQGRVTDLRGCPLAAAVVQLRRQDPSGVQCNLTQADGRYRFQVITSGAWELVAMYGGARSTMHVLGGGKGSAGIRIDLKVPVR